MHLESIVVSTHGRGLVDITGPVREILARSGATRGLVSVFVRHTSASLIISENADPAVLRDLERWLARLAPESARDYEHQDEGPDDMPAHLRAAVTKTSEQIPFEEGRLLLGTWQAIYLWEHRVRSHDRAIVVTVVGA